MCVFVCVEYEFKVALIFRLVEDTKYLFLEPSVGAIDKLCLGILVNRVTERKMGWVLIIPRGRDM